MNKRLRSKILKELKFLLNEEDTIGQEASGAGYFSEDLDDIIEDINDANKENAGSFIYIDLTTYSDSTDQGELSKFITACKSFSDDTSTVPPNLNNAMNKVCTNPILLINTVGADDSFYYISCKKVGSVNVPISAKFIGKETDEALVMQQIKKIQSGESPAPPSPSGGGGGAKSFQCAIGDVAKFQNWLKKQGQKICADDKFGGKTFAAAKAVGGSVLDFSMYNSLQDFADPAKKNKLCGDLAGDPRWKDESSTPEVCGKSGGKRVKKVGTTAAPKTPAANYVNVNIKPQQLIDLGFTGRFIKDDPAKLDSEMQKVSVSPELLTVLEKGEDYQLLESYRFHDKLKVNKAALVYESLMKKWI